MPGINNPYPLRHSFRDPVYGFILVSDPERQLIDSLPMQRLRRIHQLGTGYLVYHGAEHSRFGHALGTMNLAGRAFETIHAKTKELLGKTRVELSRNWQLIRLAALLHDIGHPPFSHAAEDLLPLRVDGSGHLRHEDYSLAIIGAEVAPLSRKHFASLNITEEDITAVFAGDPTKLGRAATVMHQLLSGEVDIDRMDYLLRDSLYTGVAYGRYDTERLLESLTAVKHEGQSILAVERAGIGALEGFIYARYFMYTQVYLHDVRSFYDLRLRAGIGELLQQKGYSGRYPDPGNIEEFLRMDDYWALAGLVDLARSGNEAAISIVERRHWKTVEETSPHPSADEVNAWYRAKERIEEGFPPGSFVFDDPKFAAFQPTDPSPYYRKQENEGWPVVIVRETSGTLPGLIEQESMLIDLISRERVMLLRLYARPDVYNEVQHQWRQHFRR
ncbi:MAG: HD domain-containing protein [Dehalococcoidia bacterium]